MTKRRPIWRAIDVRIPETDGRSQDCAMDGDGTVFEIWVKIYVIMYLMTLVLVSDEIEVQLMCTIRLNILLKFSSRSFSGYAQG